MAGFTIFSKQTIGKRILCFALDAVIPDKFITLQDESFLCSEVQTLPASSLVMNTLSVSCDTIP